MARFVFLVLATTIDVARASDCDAADAPRAAFRRLIEATQADCSRRCSCHGLNGGLFSSVRARAFCLLHALAAGCALVATPGGEIRSYVNHAHCSDPSGWLCHLAPISACDAGAPEVHELGEVMEQFTASVPQLRWVANRTGLLSELAVFGELVAWVLRPSPGLRETIAARRAQLNLSDESTLAVHIRHGDRVKSRGARDASARKFAHAAARLLGAHGLTAAHVMTDDPRAYETFRSALATRHHRATGIVVTRFPPDAFPSSAALEAIDESNGGAAGASGAEMAEWFRQRDRGADASDVAFDEALQLFAQVHILARHRVFLGWQASNIDHAVVELMASCRRWPVYYDVEGWIWAPGCYEFGLEKFTKEIVTTQRPALPAWATDRRLARRRLRLGRAPRRD